VAVSNSFFLKWHAALRNILIFYAMKPQTRINRLDSYLQEMNNKGFTTKPIALGNCTDVMPEFGRFQDVQRLFGLKRGTLYNLIEEGHIKSVSLRRRGQVKGVRLIYLQSVSDYLHELMDEQNPGDSFDPQI
jgi:hypothetical protein